MMTKKTYSTILLDIDSPVARLTINRPEARNSLTHLSIEEFYDALSTVAQDIQIRVLVIRGRGNDFSCGADIKHYDGQSGAQEAPLNPLHFQSSVLLHEMRAVTVAAIRGGCAGAAFGWACACDFRIADTTARFNTAFLDVGVAGDMASPWLLPRLVGAGRARDLCFFPRKVAAEEAKAIGLVSRLSSPDTFETDLEALIKRLACAAPLALQALKSNFVEAERMGLASYVALETERHVQLFKSRDCGEAFAAFAEKRAPNYEGR